MENYQAYVGKFPPTASTNVDEITNETKRNETKEKSREFLTRQLFDKGCFFLQICALKVNRTRFLFKLKKYVRGESGLRGG